jgi:hypothetical protein
MSNGHVRASRLSLMVAICLIAAAAVFTLREADKLQACAVTRKPTPSVTAKLTGVFVSWTVGRHGKTPCVSIKFIPTGRATSTTMSAPYITPDAQGDVYDTITFRVAKRLKVGDKIEIGYRSFAKRVWLVTLAKLGSSSEPKDDVKTADTPQTPTDRFVFIGVKKVRTSTGLKISILLRRGSHMLLFPAPFEPAESDDGDEPGTGSGEPKTISQQAAAFKSGDIVAVKYDTNTDAIQFKFVVAAIRPYKMYATGNITRVGKRIMRGKKYEVVYAKAGKTKLVLFVPLVDEDGGKENATRLSETLKSIGKNKARLTYCRVGGVMWLKKVSAK